VREQEERRQRNARDHARQDDREKASTSPALSPNQILDPRPLI
jgi:hypothetical protein